MAEKSEKSVAGQLGLGVEEGRPLELRLGHSFDKDGPVAFHSMKYDFKPASADTSKMAVLDVEKGNSVTVTVPNVEGSGKAHTVYKGNRQPCRKECVLIIDHKTGQITIEKLANNMQLKKTRLEGSSKASQLTRPHTPTEKLKDLKSSPKKKMKKKNPAASSTALTQQRQSPPTPPPPPPPQPQGGHPSVPQGVSHSSSSRGQHGQGGAQTVVDMSESSSSDSNSSSDSDSEPTPPPKPAPAVSASRHAASQSQPPPARPAPYSKPAVPSHLLLCQDLQLSESGSDSD